MERPNDEPEPNIVLRGGPFDGERLHVDYRAPVKREANGRVFIYGPTGEMDSEYETLLMYAVFSDRLA